MALFQQLDLKQSTSLVMTPQLRLAIKLLQLSNQELSTLVAQELQENPFLNNAEETEFEDSISNKDEDPSDLDFEDSTPEGYDEDESPWSDVSSTSARDPDDDFSFESNLSSEKTLREHLLEQFLIDEKDPKKRFLGVYLIDSLTPAGYLEESLAEIGDKLGATEGEVQRVLYRLQKCDPPGIGARDLSECLKLQLASMGELTQDVESILDRLEDLAKGDLKKTAQACGVPLDVLQEILVLIQSLNPRPGTLFENEVVQTRIPDIIMQPLPKKQGWRVHLNKETLPKVLVDKQYHVLVTQNVKKKEDRKYFTERLNSANWLIKAMDQRAQTILKVSTELIQQQHEFFQKGIQYLKPLVLRDLAEATELHESTISRVTTNKYIATPRGVFELKYFFTTAIANPTGGEAHSAELVRHRVKSLVEKENSQKPYSDDKLVNLLKEEGIQVARRTVTKYREGLNIPSSYERRRLKGL